MCGVVWRFSGERSFVIHIDSTVSRKRLKKLKRTNVEVVSKAGFLKKDTFSRLVVKRIERISERTNIQSGVWR